MNERIKMMAQKDGCGFDKLFEQEMSKHLTMPAAFNILNYEYKRYMGEERYKNYQSYRQSRRSRIKGR